MRQLISKYLHWILLAIVGISFITMFFPFEGSAHHIIALIMSGIGFVFLIYVTYSIEKNKRKEKDKAAE
ncbi:hypothetical protein [Alkalihalobacillus sp. CinArs1]|uniref:hypothetical protein n=1 Tax=Alkalihalobacillus sp. CinArs1 TaxID=2995314 RepID=UPI0022DE7CE9|nr:hypothetical protein [Alkalihalobacillus sp. CinArs1]